MAPALLPCFPEVLPLLTHRILDVLLYRLANGSLWPTPSTAPLLALPPQVVNVLLLLVEGLGFMQPPPPPSNDPGAPVALASLRALLPAACDADPTLEGELLNHLFGYSNWALTELAVALEEVEVQAGVGGPGAARRSEFGSASAQAHAQRRASVTGELCSSLLRVLELTAGTCMWGGVEQRGGGGALVE